MCYATKHLETLKETIQSLKQVQNELRRKHQEHDKLLSAKYHELETRKFNAAEGYYIAKDLQLILQERRIIKHELNRIETLCKTLNISQLENNINRSTNFINKTKKGNATYTQNFAEDVFKVVQ